MKKKDRLELIAAAVQRVKYKESVGINRKPQKLTRTQPKVKGLEAFEPDFMFDDKKTVRRIIDDSGIYDTYNSTTRYEQDGYYD